MLINFTNHPFQSWGDYQKKVALLHYKEVVDIDFPHIDPYFDELQLKELVSNYLTQILQFKPTAVHIMGEMSFTFQMIYYLTQHNIECVASTTERKVEKLADGTVNKIFEFVKFRKYQFFEETLHVIPDQKELSEEQSDTLNKLKEFMNSDSEQVFLLKGAAGTGKTTILKYFKDYLEQYEIAYKFTATTGKAAQVLEKKLDVSPSTIFSVIYSYPSKVDAKMGEDGKDPWQQNSQGALVLNFENKLRHDNQYNVIIIDEASMINAIDQPSKDFVNFGHKNLLSDIFQYLGVSTKVVFVGDECQLPPVMKEATNSKEDEAYKKLILDTLHFFQLKDIYDSLALNKSFLEKKFEVNVIEAKLTQIFRTSSQNDIQTYSQMVRENILNENKSFRNLLKFGNNILNVNLNQVPSTYVELVRKFGLESAIVIGLTNRDTLTMNYVIKEKLFKERFSKNLLANDIVMIYKNCTKTGLKNGQFAKVISVEDEVVYKAGLRFKSCVLQPLDSPDEKIQSYFIEKFLFDSSPELNAADNKNLMIDFDNRMKVRNIVRNSEAYMEELSKDAFLNALLLKLGYAITIHKSQGSEWPNVIYLYDRGLLNWFAKKNNSVSYSSRAHYTAITRAKEMLYITNIGESFNSKNLLKEKANTLNLK